MGITIAKWGNSVGLRIPSVTLKQAGLKVGDQVQTEVQADRSILIRLANERPKVDVLALIAAITPDTLPDASDVDAKPVGREIW